MININLQALQEDLRKVGIALMLLAFADIFFNNHSYLYSSYISVIGAILWVLGVIKKGEV